METMLSRRNLLRAAASLFATAALAAIPAAPAVASEASSHNGQTVSFDLSTGEPQSGTIVLEDGTKLTIGISPAEPQTLADLGNGYGTWDIYWYNVTINSGYTIRVSNYSIISLYNNWYNSIAVQINDCQLSYSSKYCEQRIYYSDMFGATSDTRVLWGRISGSTLTTGVN